MSNLQSGYWLRDLEIKEPVRKRYYKNVTGGRLGIGWQGIGCQACDLRFVGDAEKIKTYVENLGARPAICDS